MNRLRWLVVVSLVSACPQMPPPAMCSPSTCRGCCSSAGICEAGITDSTCGSSGLACTACPLGAACRSGTCSFVSQGGGTAGGNVAGGTAGGNVAGGTAGGNVAGGTAGGNVAGGTAGGNVAGGTAGGNVAGGTAGGNVAGGTAGGNIAGGTAGGNVAGGTAGGNVAGGTAGGNVAGGTAGGNIAGGTAGGNIAGGTAGGNVAGGTAGGNVAGGTAGGAALTDPLLAGELCTSGWCAELPRHGYNDFRHAFFESATRGYVISTAGHILRWNGTTFEVERQGDALGFSNAWTTAGAQLWLVGANGLVASWDGATLVRRTLAGAPQLFAVWGTSDNDVWFVGAGGAIGHWNGSALTSEASPTTSTIFGVWGTGPNDIFGVTGAGGIVRYNGFGWSNLSSPLSNTSGLYRIIGLPGGDFVVGGERVFRGSRSSGTLQWVELGPLPSNFGAFSLGTTPTGQVWAGAREGRIALWDGVSWSVTTTPRADQVYAVDTVGQFTFAFGLSGTALVRSGNTWAPLLSDGPPFSLGVRANWDATRAIVLPAEGDAGVMVRVAAGDWRAQPGTRGFVGIGGCLGDSSGVLVGNDGGFYAVDSQSLRRLPVPAVAMQTYVMACTPSGAAYGSSTLSMSNRFFIQPDGGAIISPLTQAVTFLENGSETPFALQSSPVESRFGLVDPTSFTVFQGRTTQATRAVPRSSTVAVGATSSSLLSMGAGFDTVFPTANVPSRFAATQQQVVSFNPIADGFSTETYPSADGGWRSEGVRVPLSGSNQAFACRGQRCWVTGLGSRGFIFRKDF